MSVKVRCRLAGAQLFFLTGEPGAYDGYLGEYDRQNIHAAIEKLNQLWEYIHGGRKPKGVFSSEQNVVYGIKCTAAGFTAITSALQGAREKGFE